MKQLILMRHAKTLMYSDDGTDFSRELTEDGLNDAKKAGAFLSGKSVFPEKVLCSSAVRARQTAELVVKEQGRDLSIIKLKQKLYNIGRYALSARIAEVDDSVNVLLVVGHNPVMAALSREIADCHLHGMPAGGIAALNFDIESWKEFPGMTGELLFFTYPPFGE